uniref:Uncharacterized protein MANES_05G142900 n=1 Tax=Rhizophora mucronata TaxID=61149 RepID=A0A2P2ILS5_RHIMU
MISQPGCPLLLPLPPALSFSICCLCFSASLSTADCSASRPPMSNRDTISGSFSKRASSNSFLAFVLNTSLHNMPRESGHMKNLVARRMSRYRLSASRRVLVSRCRFSNSSSSSLSDFSFFTMCLSNSSSKVSGPSCKRRLLRQTTLRVAMFLENERFCNLCRFALMMPLPLEM